MYLRVDEYLSRRRVAVLLLADCLAWCGSLFGMLWLNASAHEAPIRWPEAFTGLAVVLGLQMCFGTVFWVYNRRYTLGSMDEAMAIAWTTASSGAGLLAVSTFAPSGPLVPSTLPLIAALEVFCIQVAVRQLWRAVREHNARSADAVPALVMGVGNAGNQLIESLLSDSTSPYVPVGLIDDDPEKRFLRIQGVPVLGNRTALQAAVSRTGAEVLIIAIPSATSQMLRDVVEESRGLGLQVKVLPSLREILTGAAHVTDLRDINITDVLGRDPVDTGVDATAWYLRGKTVLVTGAGGSIGSELCRQIVRFEPGKLVMLDRDESALHSLQMSITGRALLDTDDVVLADIRDQASLAAVFSRHQPDVVFHAAALKHLPLLEQYPEEGWKTNVLGTANVLEAARAVDVDVFVNISTDKAANPTSVLGYSKRIAERLTAHVAESSRGKFVSVRFGNVLGSRGSVLHAFTDQISRGGPVTVTHPEVTRYFMMIPEACQLVIQAAAVGRGGEALVLHMGKPVRILDVARQMIAMSGRSDVDVVFTGLRPGEKMNEELFGEEEGQRRTRHPLVDAVPVPPLEPDSLRRSPMTWEPALLPVG